MFARDLLQEHERGVSPFETNSGRHASAVVETHSPRLRWPNSKLTDINGSYSSTHLESTKTVLATAGSLRSGLCLREHHENTPCTPYTSITSSGIRSTIS